MPRVRPNGWWAVVAWIVSRSLMACLFINLGSYLRSDVIYYFTSVQGASPMHLAGVLSEYPVPIVWLIQLLAAISGPSADVFVFVFAATMGGLDAACCRWLWRHSPRACSLWIAFTFLIGPLIWFRIDLVPAALVLAALTMTTRRPAWSGAAVALGAATKLWPALLIVPLAGTRRSARRRAGGFLLVGALIGTAVVVSQGLARSASPLTWQATRGLQIESVWATLPMVQRLVSPDDSWSVAVSSFHAYEISGPGVAGWLQVSSAATAALLALTALLGWLIALDGMGLPGHRRALPADPDRDAQRHEAMLWALLAIIVGVIVANKAFSPQYMMWLAGPLAMLWAEGTRAGSRRPARRVTIMALAAAGLTQLVFPLNYTALVGDHPGGFVTTVLVARNLVMVGLALHCTRHALRAAWRVGLRSDPAPDSGRELV